MIFIYSFIYSAVVTSTYFLYVHKSSFSISALYILIVVICAPSLLFPLKLKFCVKNWLKLSAATILGSTLSFTVIGFIKNELIWLKATAIFAGVCLIGILVINAITISFYFYRRIKSN